MSLSSKLSSAKMPTREYMLELAKEALDLEHQIREEKESHDHKVIIKPAWSDTAGQAIASPNGNTWNIAAVIEYAKDLPVFDLPLIHLSIARKTIAETSLYSFVAHMKQVLAADLSHPIILDDEGAIFDGCHRVAKALLNDHYSIKAKRFEKDPSPTYNEKKVQSN